MNYEESRLRTFENWPSDAVVDSRRIAKAGFYYMGQGLEVQCFSCGVRISEWNYGDKVMARHRFLDPGCSFVRDPAHSGNVPIMNDSRRMPTERSPVLRTRSRMATPSSANTRYQSFEARLISFSNWPIPFIVSAEQLAHSGFFYTKTADQVQCAFCDVLIDRWEPGDDPDTEHSRHYSMCPYMNQRSRDSRTEGTSGFSVRDLSSTDNNSVTTLKELGIQSHRVPRYPKYSTYESRLRTYTLWPKSLSQKPEDLADAGFFFTGSKDQVRCFHCDGGLKCWEKSDIPWQEHARWFPNCGFIILIKGQQYIDEALTSLPPVINESRETVAKPASSALSRVRSVTEEELQELMSTPCAVAALQVGIEASRVKLALRQKVELTGIPYSSADALIVAALDIQSEENTLEEMDETWATPPDSPIIGWGRGNSRRRHTLSSSDESDREDLEPFSTSSNEKEKPCNKAVNSSEPLQVLENSIPNNQSDKMTLEEENRRLKEARLCKICMDNEVCVVFLPCGHLVTCVHCAHSLNDCPLCRQPIKATVRTFLS